MTAQPAGECLLTVEEVAVRLRKGRAFVYSEIHSRRLPAKKFGRSYGIRPEDFEDYIKPEDPAPQKPRNTRERIKQLMRQV